VKNAMLASERTEKKHREWDAYQAEIRQRAFDFGLVFSCRRCDLPVVKLSITQLRANVNTMEAPGMPCLHSVIECCITDDPRDIKERIKCLALLLKYGADIELRDSEYDTPLAVAVKKNCVEIVEYLLDRGAQICAITYDDKNVISLAAGVLHNEGLLHMLENRPTLEEFFMDWWTEAANPTLYRR